ncbi:MAG TPA: ABC transporter ATP-binding protein [Armatimonadota bacterium]|jgi:putative ABC transport system ATP-binding protein
MALIEVDRLTKTYHLGSQEVRALRGVSLEVQRGEFLAIMGPSGSGKSTFMNLIGCLDTPTSGSYTLDGIQVSGMNEDELAEIRGSRIGFVYQTFNLLARTTALQNVELPLFYVGAANRREIAMRCLEAVGLGDRMHHKPNELSGGQQQRVAIARAMVNDPPIIFGDEPTGNLDTSTGEEIMSIFGQFHRAGKTVVIITHEEDIAEHAQRIIRFKDGVIVGDEPVSRRRGDTSTVRAAGPLTREPPARVIAGAVSPTT